jgi:hypothetical protein
LRLAECGSRTADCVLLTGHERINVPAVDRLLDGPGVILPDTGEPRHAPDVYTDLRPEDARSFAFTPLSAAEHAESQKTLKIDWFRQR